MIIKAEAEEQYLVVLKPEKCIQAFPAPLIEPKKEENIKNESTTLEHDIGSFFTKTDVEGIKQEPTEVVQSPQERQIEEIQPKKLKISDVEVEDKNCDSSRMKDLEEEDQIRAKEAVTKEKLATNEMERSTLIENLTPTEDKKSLRGPKISQNSDGIEHKPMLKNTAAVSSLNVNKLRENREESDFIQNEPQTIKKPKTLQNLSEKFQNFRNQPAVQIFPVAKNSVPPKISDFNIQEQKPTQNYRKNRNLLLIDTQNPVTIERVSRVQNEDEMLKKSTANQEAIEMDEVEIIRNTRGQESSRKRTRESEDLEFIEVTIQKVAKIVNSSIKPKEIVSNDDRGTVQNFEKLNSKGVVKKLPAQKFKKTDNIKTARKVLETNFEGAVQNILVNFQKTLMPTDRTLNLDSSTFQKSLGSKNQATVQNCSNPDKITAKKSLNLGNRITILEDVIISNPVTIPVQEDLKIFQQATAQSSIGTEKSRAIENFSTTQNLQKYQNEGHSKNSKAKNEAISSKSSTDQNSRSTQNPEVLKKLKIISLLNYLKKSGMYKSTKTVPGTTSSVKLSELIKQFNDVKKATGSTSSRMCQENENVGAGKIETENVKTAESAAVENTAERNVAAKNTAAMNTAVKKTTAKNTAAKIIDSKNSVGENTALGNTVRKNTAAKNTVVINTAAKNSASQEFVKILDSESLEVSEEINRVQVAKIALEVSQNEASTSKKTDKTAKYSILSSLANKSEQQSSKIKVFNPIQAVEVNETQQQISTGQSTKTVELTQAVEVVPIPEPTSTSKLFEIFKKPKKSKITVAAEVPRNIRTLRIVKVPKANPEAATPTVKSTRRSKKSKNNFKKPKEIEIIEASQNGSKLQRFVFIGDKAPQIPKNISKYSQLPKNFYCDLCGNNFRDKNQLKYHIEQVHLTEMIKCGICDKEIKLSRKKSHMNECHSGYKSTCKICGKKITKGRYFNDHMNIHKKPFECRICGKKFSRRRQVRKHEPSHEKKEFEIFECKLCGMKSMNWLCHKRHQNIHNRNLEKSLKCSKCDFATNHQKSFEKHLKGHLRKEKEAAKLRNPLNCDKCPAILKNRQALRCHMTNCHPTSPFECDLCGRIINAKSNVTKHMKFHLSIKKFDENF